jgi:hypothetical protein
MTVRWKRSTPTESWDPSPVCRSFNRVRHPRFPARLHIILRQNLFRAFPDILEHAVLSRVEKDVCRTMDRINAGDRGTVAPQGRKSSPGGSRALVLSIGSPGCGNGSAAEGERAGDESINQGFAATRLSDKALKRHLVWMLRQANTSTISVGSIG